MSTRSEKERFKGTQEKAQAILSALLKDDDNKYCVDCDAKGPRWASWNLGIFLCIRCAGIHRNLGVHISRVKSVNLDTWTPEQISMMMEIGNSRARAVYEANIPDNFRRPQIDSPLESFIRAKYEHKKYIAREWIPPTPKVPKEFIEDDTRDKKRPKPKSGMVQLNAAPKSKSSPSASNGSVKKSPESSKPTQPETVTSAQQKKSSASLDLLGLDTPTQNTSNSDLLGDLLGGPPPVQPSSAPNNTNPAQQTTPPGQTTPKQPQQTTNGTSTGEESLMSETQSKSTKESILALYGSGNSQQQQFGVPGGVYMPQQASPQQMGMYGGMPVMGMGQQPGMMGQQPNMMGQQPHMMGQNPNLMGQQPNMMGQQPNMMGQQPNLMGQQPNMMGQQPNMMGQQPGMMGQQQGMMAMQPTPEQLYMYHQQMSGQYYEYMPYEQQPNMYGMGMMGGGGAMMMQPGATPNQMGNNVGVYNQPQMQQYQQMQQQVSAMKIGNSTGLGMGGQSNWGAPSTLSNNLWQ